MATFVSINNKTKVIVRKQGYPTHCKTFLKKCNPPTNPNPLFVENSSKIKQRSFLYVNPDIAIV